MRSHLVVAFTTAIALFAMSGRPNAQRFTSRAVGVRVDVLVADGKKPVSGLTAADFELRDAGVVQDVRQLDIEQLPLNLVMAFDVSQSVNGPRLVALRDAARAVVASLREPDKVALLSFATRVRLLAPLTPSRVQIGVALDELAPAGATSLRDAVFAAIALRQQDQGRSLVLVFSDGQDTSSWLTAPRVLEAARRTDAVVYAIGIRQQTSVTGYAFGGRFPTPTTRVETVEEMGSFLRSVTEETGGRALFASTNADLRETFARTMDEFRNRYVLSYTPAGVSSSGWHPLEVKLKSKKGKVTARRGYFADPGPSPSSR
jgi:VWFA-related protein